MTNRNTKKDLKKVSDILSKNKYISCRTSSNGHPMFEHEQWGWKITTSKKGKKLRQYVERDIKRNEYKQYKKTVEDLSPFLRQVYHKEGEYKILINEKGERGIGIKVKALSSFSDPVRLLEELIKYGLLKVTVDE